MGEAIDIRPLTEADRPALGVVAAAAFGEHDPEGGRDERRAVQEPGRGLGAVVGGRLVGMADAFSFGLTVPGGAVVPVAGVTGVAVAPTHRRRGCLRALMAAQLDDVADRGEPVAVLNASESGIYRRFGYGIATFQHAYEIDPLRARFREPVGDDLDLRLITPVEAAVELPPLYDAWRLSRPGPLTQSEAWWRCVLSPHESWIGGGALFVVVCRPGADHAGGYALYTVDTDGPLGRYVLEAREVVAADPGVEARLWRYLLDVDLVGTVKARTVAVDCPLRWWITDSRQVRTVAARDWLHVRLLDVPAALAARRYGAEDELVLAVHDGFRPTTAGRYRLRARAGSVDVDRTGAEPDLELDVAELGALYLGGVSARQLHQAGLVTQCTTGAVDRADALFAAHPQPISVTRF